MSDKKLIDFYVNSIKSLTQTSAILFALGADREIVAILQECVQSLESDMYNYTLENLSKAKNQALLEIESKSFVKDMKKIANNTNINPVDGREE